MFRVVRFLALLTVAACSQAARAPAPKAWVVKVNVCGEEAEAANRERVIRASDDRLAHALFRQAECQRRHLATHEVTLDNVVDYADDVKRTRGLYWEAFRTHEPRWEIASLARIGDLYGAAAVKIEGLGREDLGPTVDQLRAQAGQAYRWALIHADGAAPDVLAQDEVVSWLEAACIGLGQDAVESPVCGR
jgi:hypothetical protein